MSTDIEMVMEVNDGGTDKRLSMKFKRIQNNIENTNHFATFSDCMLMRKLSSLAHFSFNAIRSCFRVAISWFLTVAVAVRANKCWELSLSAR